MADNKKQKNKAFFSLLTLSLWFFYFPEIGSASDFLVVNELTLSSVKGTEYQSSLGFYLGSGYFKDIEFKKGTELYFSAGLSYALSAKIDLQAGGFVDFISGYGLIHEVGVKSLRFQGIEFAALHYPFNTEIIKPLIGAKVAFTLFPAPFVRSSLFLGFKVSFLDFFHLTAHYDFNYVNSSKLNLFYSHLGSLYFAFQF